MPSEELWRFFPLGYILTILVETPIVFFGLSPQHPKLRKVFAGIWLTACTYPIVVLVLPQFFASRFVYLLVAETFAPVAECALFWLAFGRREVDGLFSMGRDFVAIVLANLASFTVGEVFNAFHWFGLLI